MTENLGITKSDFILICIGIALIFLRALFVSGPDELITPYVGEKVSFTGEISREPDERDINTRYTVDIDDSSSKIILVSNRFPKFNYGDKVEVHGKLELPKNFKGDTDVEFDYVNYLRKDGIHFTMFQPEIVFVGSGGNPLLKNLFKFKNFLQSNVARVVPEPNSSFLGGLIFGTRQSLGKELLEMMKNVGIIHVVAISGYNVTIIAVSILYITSYLRKRNLGLALSAIFIFLFALMVGFGSTVVRASIMAVIAILARYLGRNNLALRSLFVAVFLMLLWNPLLLFYDPSFQLSVLATLGLILFSPIAFRFFSFVPQKFGFREIVSTTFAVQIFLLPVLIKMSGTLSLVSFFLNIMILPLVPLAMLLGFFTGFTGAVFSSFSYLGGEIISWPFGALAYLVTEFILKSAELASKIPLAYLSVPQVSLWFVIPIYILYGYLYLKLKKKVTQPS